MDAMNERDEVYSEKVRAGKRTYFFDIRATRSNDYYITITESKRRFNGRGYDKHKIFLYKEDFNKFLNSLSKTIDHVKTELMPDYDYEEFDRKRSEYQDEFNPPSQDQNHAEHSPENLEVSTEKEMELDTEELTTSWED